MSIISVELKCKIKSLAVYAPELLKKSRAKTVGVMTCALNEVACVAFTVGALLDFVDLYVFIDTGSTDGTPELLEEIYTKEIQQGKLIIQRLGKLPDYDISIARNCALKILRKHQIQYFLKIDADDVMYRRGIKYLLRKIENLPEDITSFSFRDYELYQSSCQTNKEWFQAIQRNENIFWKVNDLPCRDRVYATSGASAIGKWTDESQGLHPEGIVHEQQKCFSTGTDAILSAHYGWARPILKKREKISIWHGQYAIDPRVCDLEHLSSGKRLKTQFQQHPEIFQEKIDQVIRWYTERH